MLDFSFCPFSLKNFAIISEKKLSQNSGTVTFFLSLTKENLSKPLTTTYLCLSQSSTRKLIPKKILAEMENGKTSLLTFIHRNEMLLGILLGYGEHNAIL